MERPFRAKPDDPDLQSVPVAQHRIQIGIQPGARLLVQNVEPCEQLHQQELGGPGGPIIRLEGKTETQLRQCGAEDAFGAGLDQRAASGGRQDACAKAVAAGDHVGLVPHGPGDAGAGCLSPFRLVRGIREARHRQREVSERDADLRNAAAVDAPGSAAQVEPAHHLEDPQQRLLNRVFPLDVAFGRHLQVAGEGEEACVFTRAVVVKRAAFAAGAQKLFQGGLVIRRLRSAFQVFLAEADPLQPGLNRSHLFCFSVMAGAGERHLRIGTAKSLGGATFHKAKGLQRLDRRTRIDKPLHVSGRKHHAAACIDDRDRGTMPALDHAATGHLDQKRVYLGAFGMNPHGMLVLVGGAHDRLSRVRCVAGSLPKRPLGCKFACMRGYFGIGVEGISKAMNLGNLQRSAHAFGASFFFTVAPKIKEREVRLADTSKAQDHLPVYHFTSPDELMLPRKCLLIGIELTDEAVELPSFRHPLAAAYVLGPERGSLSADLQARCDAIVKIPTRFCVNVGVAGAIVMYDRLLSLGRHAPRPQSSLGKPEPLAPHVHGKQVIRSERKKQAELT